MKLVLDANVIISSFFWEGNPRTVLKRIIANQDEFYITKEILDEIENVIKRPKFHLEKPKIEYLIKSIEEISIKNVVKKRRKNGSRDRTDNKYIECGITAGADYIISGDMHLLEMKKYGNIKIITPKEYLEIIKS